MGLLGKAPIRQPVMVRTGVANVDEALPDSHHPDRQWHPICRAAPQPQHRLVPQMRFDMIRETNGIEHQLTKPNHPWTNRQVERMNRTIKEATVKRFYESHDQLRTHLADFMAAYNFVRSLKTRSGL